MEWEYPKRRRSREWIKGKSMGCVSAPPIHLMAIFGIVITLLWLSQYRHYNSQIHNAALSFQLFLFFLPLLIIFSFFFFIGGTGSLNFHNVLTTNSQHPPQHSHY